MRAAAAGAFKARWELSVTTAEKVVLVSVSSGCEP